MHGGSGQQIYGEHVDRSADGHQQAKRAIAGGAMTSGYESVGGLGRGATSGPGQARRVAAPRARL